MPAQPVAEDPLPLIAPFCGRCLAVRLNERDASPQWVYPVHGKFRIDATGLRNVPGA